MLEKRTQSIPHLFINFANGLAESAVNYLLKKTPQQHKLIAPLADKILAIKLAEQETQLFLFFQPQHIDILAQYEGEVDCAVTLKKFVLIRLPKRSELAELINQKQIIFQGDLQVLQNFIHLLECLEKDPTELLSPFIGDVMAYSFVNAGKKSAVFLQQCLQQQQRYMGERLAEEWQVAVPRLAFLDFSDQVEKLAKESERLTQKIRQLEQTYQSPLINTDK